MTVAALSDVILSSTAGYWGTQPKASDVSVKVIRNGDVKPGRGVIWSQLPVRGFRSAEVDRSRVRKGDLLITTSGDCGVVARVAENPSALVCASNFIRVLRVDESLVNPDYLYHFMQSTAFRNALRPFIRGSTIQNLSVTSAFASLAVPLPPLVEQGRMATILDRVHVIKQMCDASTLLLGRMRVSEWQRLFGPRLQEWRTEQLGDVITGSRLGLVRAASEQGHGRQHAYVRMDAISRDGQLLPQAFTYVDATEAERASVMVEDGDLLFNTRNTRELVGKTAIYRGSPAIFNNNLMRLRFDDRLISEYVHAYLWSSGGVAQLNARKAGTTSVVAIYAKALKTLEIPMPPRSLQDEFAGNIRLVAAQHARGSQRIAAVSKLAQAFHGDFFSH